MKSWKSKGVQVRSKYCWFFKSHCSVILGFKNMIHQSMTTTKWWSVPRVFLCKEWWCKDLSIQDVYIKHSLTQSVSWKNAFTIDAAQKVNNDKFQKQWSTTSFSLDDYIKAITTAIKTISIKTTYRPLWNVFARKIGLVLPVSGPRMWGSRMALARGLIKCWH